MATLILGGAMALGACVDSQPSTETTTSAEESDNIRAASAVLRDANGNFVASMIFQAAGTGTLITVAARLPPAAAGIHGMHVHANDNPANGNGCIADPAQPANTHFLSADGHFNPGGAGHGNHAGDMPPLFVSSGGNSTTTFFTDRFRPGDVRGRTPIIHAGSDNLGNIPLGAATTQYTANSPEATTLTANTGNAGNRIACGVIQ